jgi:phage-related minor tail protein
MAKNSLVFSVSADIRNFSTGMQNAQRELEKVSKSMRKIGQNMSLYVTAPLTAMAYKSLEAWDQQEKAMAQVEAGLRSTGNQVGITADEFAKLASEMQNNSLFGDEEILQGVTAQLLTFTNILGDEFKQAQQASVDLASRLGGDLQSASIMLGKALNDPVANLSAMSRAGVQFSEDQSTLIKQLWATGNQAQAQSLILEELEKQYGGSAAAAAAAGTGPIKQLGMAIGDLSEEFGKIIGEAIMPLVDWLKGLVHRFQELDPGTKKIIAVMAGLAAAIGPVLMAVSAMLPALAALPAVFAAITGPVGMVVAAIGALGAAAIYVYENWQALKEFLTDWDRIKNALIDFVKFVGKRVILPIYDALKMIGLDVITDPIDAMFNKLDALKNPVSEIKTEFKSFGQTMKDFANETVFGMQSVTAAAETMNSALMSTTSGGSGGGMGQETAIGPMAMKESGPLGLPNAEEMSEINSAMMRYAETANEVAAAQNKAGESGYEMGQLIGNSISSVIKGTKTLGQAIAEVVKGIINAFVAKAIAALAADSIMKGGWFGLVAAATAPMVVGALFDKIMPKFASGGIVSGPTMGMMGEYPGARSNPEVIAPLSKLKGMMGGGSGYLYSHIRGNDIYLSNERELRIRDYET